METKPIANKKELENVSAKMPIEDKKQFMEICNDYNYIPSSVIRVLIKRFVENPNII